MTSLPMPRGEAIPRRVAARAPLVPGVVFLQMRRFTTRLFSSAP